MCKDLLYDYLAQIRHVDPVIVRTGTGNTFLSLHLHVHVHLYVASFLTVRFHNKQFKCMWTIDHRCLPNTGNHEQ